MFVRVNNELAESFSLGLTYEAPGIRRAPILRVNGDHGSHTNPDKTRIVCGPHIHYPVESVLDLPADGDRHDEYAVQLPDDVRTPMLAWPVFRAKANIEEDARLHLYLQRVRGSVGGGQMDLFDEE